MATAGIVNCSPYGMMCTECNELLIAPRSSGHVSKHEVRHFWSCDNCGHELEMVVISGSMPRRNQPRALNHQASHEQIFRGGR
jgi:hypothetical protein